MAQCRLGFGQNGSTVDGTEGFKPIARLYDNHIIFRLSCFIESFNHLMSYKGSVDT